MSSNLTAAMATRADADRNAPLIFVRIDYGYPTDPLLATTAPFSITMTGTGDSYMDNETFTALDGLSISDFKQDASGAIQEVSLALALTDSSPFIDLLDDDLWWGSPARIWFGYFDSDFASVILSPSLRISGILDKLPLTVDRDIAVVTGIIRTNRMLVERDRGNRYTAAQHQTRYPNDKCFSFLPRLVSGELLLANDNPTNVRRPTDSGYERRGYGGVDEP